MWLGWFHLAQIPYKIAKCCTSAEVYEHVKGFKPLKLFKFFSHSCVFLPWGKLGPTENGFSVKATEKFE
jgi:hypothetical protein